MASRQLIAVILTASMMLSAGCMGWGEDGPYKPDAEDEGDGETQAQEKDVNASDGDSEPTIDDGEEEERERQERVEDAVRDAVNNDSESDAGSQSDSAASDDGSDESSDGGDSDESTDKPGSTGDGDSASDDEGEDGPYTYSLTIQVVDEDGNPVPNELVQFDRDTYDDDPVERITDENGEATFQYEAETQDEYMDYTYTVRGEPRGTERVDAGEQRAQVVVGDEPRETHELEVYVDETQPIEGVDVTIERYADGATSTKTTSERGRVTFEVYPGEYTLSAQYAGEAHSEDITVEDDKTVFLPYHGTLNATYAVAEHNATHFSPEGVRPGGE